MESTWHVDRGIVDFGCPLNVIDYRCEDGSFSVSANCVTISNPDLLASSETEVNPGTTLHPDLESDNLKPRL
jgi:hypothetical protein